MDPLLHWRGAGAEIKFEPSDFDVMELAMGTVPEVRLCALVLKWMRAGSLQYPVKSVDEIVRAFPHKKFVGAGHEIDAESIRKFMAPEYFPIEDEGHLLSRTYLALVRCRMQASSADSTGPANPSR
jgi:hypothetical protein